MSYNISTFNKIYCQENANFGPNQQITFDVPVDNVYNMNGSYLMIPLQINTTNLAVGAGLEADSIYNVALSGIDRRYVPPTNFVKQVQVFCGGQQVHWLQDLNVLNQNLELYKYNVNEQKTQMRLNGFFVDQEDANNPENLRMSGFRLLGTTTTVSEELPVYCRIPMTNILNGLASSSTDLRKLGNSCMVKLLISNYNNEVEVEEVARDDLLSNCGVAPLGYTIPCSALAANTTTVVIPYANLVNLNGNNTINALIGSSVNAGVASSLVRFPFVVNDIINFSVAGGASQPKTIANNGIDFGNTNANSITLTLTVAFANNLNDTCSILATSTPLAKAIFVPCDPTPEAYNTIIKLYPPSTYGLLMDNTGLAFAIAANNIDSSFNVNSDDVQANIAYCGCLTGLYLMRAASIPVANNPNLTNLKIRKGLQCANYAAALTTTLTINPPYPIDAGVAPYNNGLQLQSIPVALSVNTIKIYNYKTTTSTATGITYNYFDVDNLHLWEGKQIKLNGTNVGPIPQGAFVQGTVTTYINTVALINGDLVLTVSPPFQVDTNPSTNCGLSTAWTPKSLEMWNQQPISPVGIPNGAPFRNFVNTFPTSIVYNANYTVTITLNQSFTPAGAVTRAGLKQWPSATKSLVLPEKWQMVLLTTNVPDDRDGYFTWVELAQSMAGPAANSSISVVWNPIDATCKCALICFPKNSRLLSSTDTYQNYQLYLNQQALVNRPVNLEPSLDRTMLYDRIIKGFNSCGVDVKMLNSDPEINLLATDETNSVIVQSIDFEGESKNYIQLQMLNGNTQVDNRNYYLFQLVQKNF